MYSGETIFTDPLIQVRMLTKSLVKHRFSLHTLLRYLNTVAVMYSRKQKKYVVILISNTYYIYLKRYFEVFVTYDFLVYSGGQLL